MQNLGTAALMTAYVARITTSHDYSIDVDVLNTQETHLATAKLVDGQVNIASDSNVRRTCTVTLLDPDHALNLDADSIWEGALFADRMIRVRHTVTVPGFGAVTCTPFIGPISKVSRNGLTIDVEAQDKTAFAVLGAPPLTVRKGANAVGAIKSILASRCGENRFHFPSGHRALLGKNYAVGWADDAAPWEICKQIASHAGLHLGYSCDGYATLRPAQSSPLFTFGPGQLTTQPTGVHDFSGVINYARVTSGDHIAKSASAPANHPLYAWRLGRNGVARYLPAVESVNQPNSAPTRPSRKHTKKQQHAYIAALAKHNQSVRSQSAAAQARADALLASGLPMTADLSWSAIPVFHLDADDLIRLRTDDGDANLAFAECSIPLVRGDMTVGYRRRVSRPVR